MRIAKLRLRYAATGCQAAKSGFKRQQTPTRTATALLLLAVWQQTTLPVVVVVICALCGANGQFRWPLHVVCNKAISNRAPKQASQQGKRPVSKVEKLTGTHRWLSYSRFAHFQRQKL